MIADYNMEQLRRRIWVFWQLHAYLIICSRIKLNAAAIEFLIAFNDYFGLIVSQDAHDQVASVLMCYCILLLTNHWWTLIRFLNLQKNLKRYNYNATIQLEHNNLRYSKPGAGWNNFYSQSDDSSHGFDVERTSAKKKITSLTGPIEQGI